MKNVRPPLWADRILEWYCRADRLEEIQGDAYELFERTAKKGPQIARLQFVWNVIRFFRLKNIGNTTSRYRNNSLTMFYSYLLIGFRNAVRNGLTSIINIGGLALGAAGAITIFIFADQWFHTDNFHVNRDRIYEVTNVINRDNQRVTLSDTPLLLGPMLQEDASGIEHFVRLEIGNGAVKRGELVFSEKIWFADPAFFEIFTFSQFGVPPNALAAKNSIVLTEPLAEKYFSDENPIGQPLSIKFANGQSVDLIVSAVAYLPPTNTLHFDLLLNMDVFLGLKLKDQYDWTYMTDATFVMMKPGHGVEEIVPLMNKYKKLQNESSPDWMIEDFKIYPLPSLVSKGEEIESFMIGSGHPQGVYAMGVIAFVLLLLACFNYTNISVATISTRLREIGIRKVIGGRKSEIVQQFIAENLLLCSFAIGLGVLISYLFFMPGLVALVDFQIPFAFSSGRLMLTFFVGILIFVVMVSGVYPAFYVSGFQPVQILKGKEKFGQRSKFSRILLTFQFVLAFMTIVGCFVFIDNSLYLRDKDWGYDHAQNIVVPVSSQEQFMKLRDKATTHKDIISQAGSVGHVGFWNQRSAIDFQEKHFEIVSYRVGYDYMETMNLRLREGRFFERKMVSDSVEAVIVNENFVNTMGWANGLNQTFMHDSIRRTVIGIVKNFHYDDFYRGILPVMFTLAPEKEFQYLSIKVDSEKVKETELLVKEWWKEIGPDDPYRGILQDDVFYNFQKNNRSDIRIIGFVAVMALLLACLGLFGLVSYNITRRLKEFSVRKVFGANTVQIFRLMNQDYVWILSIAFILGAPMGFFLMEYLIKHIYVEPQPAGALPFATAVGMMLITVALTIGSQMNRVVRENPANTLRSE